MKIMMVDDDPQIIELLCDLLPSDWHIDTFSNARSAVQRYQSRPDYDLVITDYKMDEKNGEGLVFDIKYLKPEQKIIVLTGRSSEINLPKQFDVQVLSKPINSQRLMDAIKALD